jgi:hypothetical protein
MKSEWKEIEEQRRQAEGNALRFVAVGTLVPAAFLLGAHYFDRPDAVPVQEAAPENAILPPRSFEPREAPEPSVRTARRPVAAPPAQSHVGFYECVENGQRVVSDRPCGGDTKARTLVVDQADPVEAARQWQRTRAAGQVTARPTPAAADGGDTYCIYVRSRVTGDVKAHTCRWFDSFQSCQEAADRIDGRCGSPQR